MMKVIRQYGPSALATLLGVFLISCGGSGGGADDGEVRVQYRVEMIEGGPECLSRIQHRDGNGNLRTDRDIGDTEWSRTIRARDGAPLYLEATIDCGRVEVSLYLNGSRVARDRSPRRARIEGTLRVDEEGNATFEEAG